LHAWAFAASLPAGAVLLARDGPASARVAAAVFVLSLAGVYGTSAAYHRARGAVTRRLLQRADHSMIYLLIAGTYTPVCLLALPRSVGLPLLAVVWTASALGVVCKLVGGPRLMHASSVLYLGIGWVAVAALPALVRHVDPQAMALLVVGGLLYTAGAFVLYHRRPDPRPHVFGYHEVWHAFTVVAGAAHFAMVWVVVTPAS
jgi:hemolysin III